MVKLKNGVTGFIYESCHGYIKEVFNQSLTENEMKLIDKVINKSDVLFTGNDDINSMFEFECKEDLERDVEGLNEVLEWVE
jgi:hypothetical protein